jgi:hypothetical protein
MQKKGTVNIKYKKQQHDIFNSNMVDTGITGKAF